jgi:predicted oxidoreductase
MKWWRRGGMRISAHRRLQISWAHPPKIEKPPYYAVRFVPLTRKSMGGVVIDLPAACSMLRESRSGVVCRGRTDRLAGVNGKCTLEGTFLVRPF